MDFNEAIGIVWRMAERKHQDECYEKECTYCEALAKVVNDVPSIDGTRAEAYREELDTTS